MLKLWFTYDIFFFSYKDGCSSIFFREFQMYHVLKTFE